jgi:hypothetical protein
LFWQITNTTPLRRMTLHFSHIGLTDGRTFMIPFRRLSGDPALAAARAAATESGIFASAQAKRLARGQDPRW